MSAIAKMLEEMGTVLTNDHFVYSSGKHGDTYINKNNLFAYTRSMALAGKLLADAYQGRDIETVAGPALCGIIPAHWTAYYLSQDKNKEIFSVFAEKNTDKSFEFKRGYEKFITGKNVLLIDDISTSGATIKKFIKVIQSVGGKVIAAGVVVNRNPKEINSTTLGLPFNALATMDIATYEEAECPLCKRSVPINITMGHGREYVESKK